MRATLVLTPLLLVSLVGAFSSAPAHAAGSDSSSTATAGRLADQPAAEPVTPIQPVIPNPVVLPVQALAPVALPVPSPTPILEKADEDQWSQALKLNCDRHFTGQIQSEVRAACASPAIAYSSVGKSLAQTRCRMNYGEEPRLVMSCLIGVSILEDITNKTDGYKAKLQLCVQDYPAHTEIDSFLQESCLVGTRIPELMATSNRPHYEVCATINPERSFIGPCAVGLSLVLDPNSAKATGQQNRICERYFDHKLFHLGYRSCLAARGFGPQVPTRVDDTIKACTNIISNSGSDTERAACVVGANIFKQHDDQDELAKRFQKCGSMKVSYEDREFLACITASSLISLSDKNGATAGCKEIFNSGKSKGRGNCLNSIGLF